MQVDKFDLVAETPSPSAKQSVVPRAKGSPRVPKPSTLRPVLPTDDCTAGEEGSTGSDNVLPDLAINQNEQAARRDDASRRKSIAPSLSRRVSTGLVPDIASGQDSRQVAAEG